MLTLYQAEWCPYSSAVRQLLTERGIDFVARQVEPQREQRDRLRGETGVESIPVLVDGEGRVHDGVEEILGFVSALPGWEHATSHRERYVEHREERVEGLTERLLERLAP